MNPFVTRTRRDVGATHDTPGGKGPAGYTRQALLNALMGQVDPHDPEIGPLIVVNPLELGITGWGPPNEQPYQSGHTNNVRTNQSAEQGMGVGPERKAGGHYPHATNPNPFRNLNAMQRDGGLVQGANVYRPEVVAYWAGALVQQAGQAPSKQRASGYPTVNQVPSVPFVSTVAPMTPGGY